MDDFVTIQHPDIDGTGMCSAAAFDLIYEAKGWQLAEPAGEAAAQDPEPPQGPDPSATAEPTTTSTPVNLLES